MPTAPLTTLNPEPVDGIEAPGHNGQARPKPVVFFAGPPAGIGDLYSAESTVRQDRPARSLLTRILIGLAIGAAIYFLLDFLGAQGDADTHATARIAGVVLGIIAVAVHFLASRVVPLCTYVGHQGVARYKTKSFGSSEPIADILLFADAEAVRAKQTRHYINGVYTGTSYDYRWNDSTGRCIFKIKGSHRGGKKAPKPGDRWHFANAAESAWTAYYFGQIENRLTAEGAIVFAIDKKRSVHVGPGFLEFHFGETPTRLVKEEIASVSLAGGQFSFKHKDAKWYSRAGKFSFPYGEMANAKIFLIALEKLLGYHWN